jgi:hypothetical protein
LAVQVTIYSLKMALPIVLNLNPRLDGPTYLAHRRLAGVVFGFQRLKLKKTKRLAARTVSIGQALNCCLGSKINQANSLS